jgi:hypothetical protein
MTSNVRLPTWAALARSSLTFLIRSRRAGGPAYSSSMCSKPTAGDLAARLRTMIDELAADSLAGDADEELVARLASAWTLLADADPELAARTARYAP